MPTLPPFTRLTGLVFRVTSPRYADLQQTAAMSQRYPGRFNTDAVGAVYVSREPQTAIDELCRRAARDGAALSAMHPRALFVVELDLQKVVDLTRPGALEAWGLTAEDLVDGDMSQCQALAAGAAERGAEGIRWRSATGAGQSIAVFLQQLGPQSRVRLSSTFDLTREMLARLEAGERVVDLVPAVGGIPLIP